MGYYGPSFDGLDRGWHFKTTDSRYAEERDQCLEWWSAECDVVVEEFPFSMSQLSIAELEGHERLEWFRQRLDEVMVTLHSSGASR
jgi:hypothetical protein